MAECKQIAIHFARLGPYHLARLKSAAEVLGPLGWWVVALETAGSDATYMWNRTNAWECGIERRTVFKDRVYEEISAGELRDGIYEALEASRPEAVVVAGWGTVDARACLNWCKKTGAKAIVMSETRAADGRRVWWKEWIKSRLVRQFDGALCGGESHKRYLMELGIPAARIEFGYNVVDNQFFGEIRNGECRKQGNLTTIEHAGRCEKEQLKVDPKGEGVGTSDSQGTEVEAGACLSGQAGVAFSNPFTSQLVRDSEITSCTCFADAHTSTHSTGDSPPDTELQIPTRPYFLASNRFVERKNLARLIRAYAKYVESFQFSVFSFPQLSGVAWPLVLLGDGELRGDLAVLCAELGLRKAGELSHGVTENMEGENANLHSGKFQSPAEGGLVVFAGFRQIEELPSFYAGAGALVHPALEEPWGLVINEAMASGLPVISSRNVGAAEELVLEGKTGYLFDPMSVQDMADAMARFAALSIDARREMGLAALERVESVVPLKAFGEGLANLLGS